MRRWTPHANLRPDTTSPAAFLWALRAACPALAACLPLVASLALAACSGAPAGAAVASGLPAPAARDDGLTTAELSLLADHGVAASALRCNSQRTWNPTLRAEAKAGALAMLSGLGAAGISLPDAQAETARKVLTDALMWRMVRATIVDGEQMNLGVVAVDGVRTRSGQPLLLFRSGFTARPGASDSCLASLLAAGVRHGVNLYQGPMPTADLAQAEQAAYTRVGGSYFSVAEDAELASWRDELRDEPAARERAMHAVARVIREGILAPQGHAPDGHVAVHCGGGMHRTGMVVGVLERCWNGAPRPVWEAAYRRHVAWRDAEHPGGFEPANLAFIADFDCSLLGKNR